MYTIQSTTRYFYVNSLGLCFLLLFFFFHHFPLIQFIFVLPLFLTPIIIYLFYYDRYKNNQIITYVCLYFSPPLHFLSCYIYFFSSRLFRWKCVCVYDFLFVSTVCSKSHQTTYQVLLAHCITLRNSNIE